MIIIVGNSFYFFLYKNKFALIERYKATDEPWPWESNPQEWNLLFWKTVKFSFFNIFVTNPLIGIPFYLIDVKVENPQDYNFPTGLTLFLQLIFLCFAEDIMFYLGHSTLHRPYFYKRIHKYHHEHKETTSIACIHAHPFEYFIANIIPVLSGSLILGKRSHGST